MDDTKYNELADRLLMHREIYNKKCQEFSNLDCLCDCIEAAETIKELVSKISITEARCDAFENMVNEYKQIVCLYRERLKEADKTIAFLKDTLQPSRPRRLPIDLSKPNKTTED